MRCHVKANACISFTWRLVLKPSREDFSWTLHVKAANSSIASYFLYIRCAITWRCGKPILPNMPKRKGLFGASCSNSAPTGDTNENQSSPIHMVRTYTDPVGNKWYGRKRCFLNKPILMHDTMGPVSHIFIGDASLRPPRGVTDSQCIRLSWEDLFDKRCEQEMYCRWHGLRVPKARSAKLFNRRSPNSKVIKALEREIDQMQRRLDIYHFTQ